jgi:4-hydroxy-3-polyprenylbenzoate decarboxylase
MPDYTLAITGASGSLCGLRLLRELATHPDVDRVNVIASRGARKVAQVELSLDGEGLTAFRQAFTPEGAGARVRWLEEEDLAAPTASGSHPNAGMAIVPCSTATLASIACGTSRNLIHRSAEVALKERRRLVLGIRESPYSLVHIENMRQATLAGAVIAPISPMFYNHPAAIGDVVEQYVGRVLDLLGLEHRVGRRWKSDIQD